MGEWIPGQARNDRGGIILAFQGMGGVGVLCFVSEGGAVGAEAGLLYFALSGPITNY